VLTSLGEKLSDEEVDELLKFIEVDKNGFVNYEQFVRVVLAG
jgi:calmodulin